MSALEMNRLISAETLLKYIPQQGASLPALYRGEQAGAQESLSERDLLYKVLFDMKKT